MSQEICQESYYIEAMLLQCNRTIYAPSRVQAYNAELTRSPELQVQLTTRYLQFTFNIYRRTFARKLVSRIACQSVYQAGFREEVFKASQLKVLKYCTF